MKQEPLFGVSQGQIRNTLFPIDSPGTKLIPTDFIGYKESLHGEKDHHAKLMANFFAQTEALMNGKSAAEVVAELQAAGKSDTEVSQLTPFKIFDGNKPTNTLLIEKLTPKSLGALVAMYEHKIFVQGIIWNIFSYDQWGVELGKQLAKNILSDIEGDSISAHDASTTTLLERFKA